jgi:hypothetical protein
LAHRSLHGLCQPHAERVIAPVDVADADEADAALETQLELLTQVGHQMSSPSFLICA